MSSLPEILVIPHNHFDPTWRRCFDRPADYNGVRVRSYAEIEDLVLSRSLELSPRGFTQSEGQMAIWRKFLERRPEMLEPIREEIRQGRLCLTLAGETVQDSNLPTAEGLVRNFLVALPLVRELAGDDHAGLKIAWVEDTFGLTPNYPQILKGVGAETIWRTSYRPCPGEVLVGIDGTQMTCMDHVPNSAAWSVLKYPPCPKCQGHGCAACANTGMVLLPVLTKAVVMERLDAMIRNFLAPPKTDEAEETFATGLVFRQRLDTALVPYLVLGGEEVRAEPDVIEAVEEIAEKYHGQVTVRFGTHLEIYERERERLDQVLAAHGTAPAHDLNPAMPGCYVTRIQAKQRTRHLAYLLTAAESLIANRTWAEGRPVSQPADLTLAWQRLSFCQFHDAVTGTLIDSAYVEMMEMLDKAEEIARRYVPSPPAEKPVEGTVVDEKGLPREITWGAFEIRFDMRGITQVLTEGRDLFASVSDTETLTPFRIGELTLESDFGDAWGQRIAPMGHPTYQFSRRGLGEFHDRLEMGDNFIRWHGSYRGGHRKVKALEWTTRVELSDDRQRLNFTTEVDWDTESKRLRVVFPIASDDTSALYEVPFGFIERNFDASKLDYSQWNADAREFPIQNWIYKKIAADSGVALLVKGIPSARWMPRLLDLSLLRSPEWEFCVVEPCFYEFWDTDGQRDTGRHIFEYSLWPHVRGTTTDHLTREALRYYSPDFQAPAFEIHGAAVITAWKPADDGQGWILRLHETLGQDTEIEIGFGRLTKITPCDLLERSHGGQKATRSQKWRGPLHRHGILTLRLE